MKYIETAIALFKFLPALIIAIKAIEEAIPGQGKGEQKLALVRGLLEDIATVDMDSIWPTVQKWCAKIVKLFNDLGIFQKTTCTNGGECPE